MSTQQCPFCGSAISVEQLAMMRERIRMGQDPAILQEFETMRVAIRDEEKQRAKVEIDALRLRLEAYKQRDLELDKREAGLKAREVTMDAEVKKGISERATSLRAEIIEELSQQHKSQIQDRDHQLVELNRQLTAQKELQDMEVERRLAERERDIRSDEESRVQRLYEPLRAKIEEYRKKETEVLQKEEAVSLREQEIDLRVTREVAQKRGEILKEAHRQAEEKHGIQLKEYERVNAGLRQQLEDAQQLIQSGSPQRRGLVQQEEIGDLLEKFFPEDEVIRIASGVRGADVLQTVKTASVGKAGSIYWESKRTKDFHPSWIPKLKKDQQDRKADIGAIVTTALPEDSEDISIIDGIVVVHPRLMAPVASLMRQYLLNVARQRLTLEQRGSKIDQLYKYMTGNEFLQRVAAIVDAQAHLSHLNDSERRAHEKVWATRDQLQLNIGKNIAALYGDIEGIVGALPTVQGLQLPPGTKARLASGSKSED